VHLLYKTNAAEGPIRMSETQSKFGGARVHFPPPLVFPALVGAGVAVGRWMWPFAVPLAFWPRITAGAVVTLAGVTLVLSARIWFTRTGQSPIPWKPSPELLVKAFIIIRATLCTSV